MTAEEKSPPRVFISYAWEYQPLAKQLQADLQRDGVEVFVDYEKITGGDSLPARISAALEWCNTLILLWSAEAAQSYYVAQEWESAFHLQKRIIPCVLDGTVLPALLRGRLYLNFSSFEWGYVQLCHALGIKPSAASKAGVSSATPIQAPQQHIELSEAADPAHSQPHQNKTPSGIPKPKLIQPAIFFKQKWTDMRSVTPSWWKKERRLILTLGLIVVAAIFLAFKMCHQPSPRSIKNGNSFEQILRQRFACD
jgi:hypothetical protein